MNKNTTEYKISKKDYLEKIEKSKKKKENIFYTIMLTLFIASLCGLFYIIPPLLYYFAIGWGVVIAIFILLLIAFKIKQRSEPRKYSNTDDAIEKIIKCPITTQEMAKLLEKENVTEITFEQYVDGLNQYLNSGEDYNKSEFSLFPKGSCYLVPRFILKKINNYLFSEYKRKITYSYSRRKYKEQIITKIFVK